VSRVPCPERKLSAWVSFPVTVSRWFLPAFAQWHARLDHKHEKWSRRLRLQFLWAAYGERTQPLSPITSKSSRRPGTGTARSIHHKVFEEKVGTTLQQQSSEHYTRAEGRGRRRRRRRVAIRVDSAHDNDDKKSRAFALSLGCGFWQRNKGGCRARHSHAGFGWRWGKPREAGCSRQITGSQAGISSTTFSTKQFEGGNCITSLTGPQSSDQVDIQTFGYISRDKREILRQAQKNIQ